MSTVHITALAVQRASRRLSRSDVARTWGRDASGDLAVCGPDEDALTLSVGAASGLPPALVDVDVVVFASPASPRPGAACAATAAVALGLDPAVRTIDLAGSRRCFADAVELAADLVEAVPDRRVLVLAGDDRVVPLDDVAELERGHAGVAALVSADPGAARIVTAAAVSDAVPDRWLDETGATRTAGERFLATAVWPDQVSAATAEVVGRDGADLAGVHVAASTPRLAKRLAALADADAATASPELWELGDAGAAMPGLLLAAALRRAVPGERHLLVTLGSGVGALLLEAGPDREAVTIDDGAPTAPLPYGLALRHAGRLVQGPSAPDASPVAAWRDVAAVVGLVGARCSACGQRAYPRWSSCPACSAIGPGVPVRMVGEGRVATFTTDHLVAGVNPGTPESPTTMVVVDLDDGGRLFLPAVAGTEPSVGQRVRTVFRVAHDGGGFRHHHWRVAPLDHEEGAA